MMREQWAQRIDVEGYLCRRGTSHKVPVPKWHREWVGKKAMTISIASLPERYWGKRITIKIDIVDDKPKEEKGDDREWLRIC